MLHVTFSNIRMLYTAFICIAMFSITRETKFWRAPQFLLLFSKSNILEKNACFHKKGGVNEKQTKVCPVKTLSIFEISSLNPWEFWIKENSDPWKWAKLNSLHKHHSKQIKHEGATGQMIPLHTIWREIPFRHSNCQMIGATSDTGGTYSYLNPCVYDTGTKQI